MNTPNTLYLIPVPLGAPDAVSPGECLPAPAIERIRTLNHFVAENAKSARAFLKAVGTHTPLQQLSIHELNEHTSEQAIPALLEPLRQGHDLGLVSEAGCPAVADPGSGLVAAAHQAGFRVKPLIGPSSLLLALMAAGLSGQNFTFHGYLPVKADERMRNLRELEIESRKYKRTQLFIETPYRNAALLDTLLTACRPDTVLAIACDLTLPGEMVFRKTIAEWKKVSRPDLNKRPAVFLLQAF